MVTSQSSRLRVILAGTPETSAHVASGLIQAGHELVATLCPFPKPVGRKQIVTPSPLESWASKNQVRVFHVDAFQLRGDEEQKQTPPLKSELKKILGSIDLLVVADFGFLIPEWLLAYPKFGGLNIHPSKLPRWRGAGPVPFTILFGDTDSAVSIIHMNEQFDLGEVVAQTELPVFPRDTTATLLQRGFQIGTELLINTIPDYINRSIVSIPQPKESPTPVTYKKDLAKEWGFIPWSVLEWAQNTDWHVLEPPASVPLLEKYQLPLTPIQLDRMIRAFHPKPKVWTLMPDGKRMIIHESNIVSEKLQVEKIQIEGRSIEVWKK